MVTPLDALVEQARALADDLRLDAVRRWKAEAPGRFAIGCLPVWTPRELIHAAGGLPVGVRGGGDAVEVVRGDAYFQSYICQLPRSTLELALDGSLDPLDGVIFPSTCDVIRNLSGMWQLLFPDKLVRYLDVPQSLRPELGGAFFARELKELLHDLQRLGGRPVTDEALWASIAAYDAHRQALEEVYALRAAQPWLVPTSELYLVLRAGDVLPVEAHTAMLRDYRALAAASGRPVEDQARVALTGCFCERPPLGLIQTIERSGCAIVEDDLALGQRFVRGDVTPSGAAEGPLEALALAFIERGRAAQTMFLPDHCAKGAALVDDARRAGAEGVIFAAASFCDPALLDQPMTAKAVEAAGLPSTSFKYAENTGQFQSIREQTGAFADTIKIWSEA
ncbi:MAG: benzoyl-CoA reductase subunit C [Planctomycetes bacterium]|nr:benzoyl-CoA reductase subunit C [Planctomycetota bacterium]